MALKNEVQSKISVLVVTAFGLVAALAWNDAVKALFSAIFGSPENLPAQVAYAVIVTIIAVVVTMAIGKKD